MHVDGSPVASELPVVRGAEGGVAQHVVGFLDAAEEGGVRGARGGGEVERFVWVGS